jgi:hypothetical protein
MTSLLRVARLTCALSGLAFAQTGPAGHWEGSIQLPDREIKIALDLARDDKGVWTGAFSQITQNVRNVPASDLKPDGESVKRRSLRTGRRSALRGAR